MNWHRELPADSERDVLDMLAKAMMVRLGGSVTVSMNELRNAGATQAEFTFDENGALSFRIERS